MANRSFPSAGGTHQRHFLSHRRFEGNTVEHFPAGTVFKFHLFKNDFTFQFPGIKSIRGVLLVRGFHHLQKPLKAGHAVLILLHKGNQLFDGAGKGRNIENEGCKIDDSEIGIKIAKQTSRQIHGDQQNIRNQRGTGREASHGLIVFSPHLDKPSVRRNGRFHSQKPCRPWKPGFLKCCSPVRR